MLIAFQTPQLDVRGSCVAIYDYAHYNEVILHNKSVILVPRNSKNDIKAINKFSRRFPIIYYKNLDKALYNYNIKILYTIKYGRNDGVYSIKVPTIVHCVFDLSEPHGDIYIPVSETLAEKFNYTNPKLSFNYLPHVVNQKPTLIDPILMRRDLNIPRDAIVIGRHGGLDTFNIEFVKKVISKIVREKDNIYFLLMNTGVFDHHKQIIHLSPTADFIEKDKFISTCDAGLEASTLGHTFGLACAEMSVNNKPMIVYNGNVWNDAHIKILGDKGIYFKNEEEFYDILNNFDKRLFRLSDRSSNKQLRYEYKDSFNCYKEFSPIKVMSKFKTILDTLCKNT